MPRSLPFTAVAAALTLLAISTASADEPPRATAAESQGVSAGLPPLNEQFRRPDLVAMAWASPKVGANSESAIEEGLKAWKPDGTAIPPQELKALKLELPEFGSLDPQEGLESLTPLHLVFRIDERAVNSQTLRPALVSNERRIVSQVRQEGSSAGRLALAVMAPSPKALPKWPAKIDLELRMPIDEGQVFQTVKQLGDRPVEVTAGVRLTWTMVPSPDNSGKLAPAVAMELDPQQTAAVEYDFVLHRTDGSAESLNARRMVRDREVHVSPPLESREELDHIDIGRLRYRTEVYDKLPILGGDSAGSAVVSP